MVRRKRFNWEGREIIITGWQKGAIFQEKSDSRTQFQREQIHS